MFFKHSFTNDTLFQRVKNNYLLPRVKPRILRSFNSRLPSRPIIYSTKQNYYPYSNDPQAAWQDGTTSDSIVGPEKTGSYLWD